MADAFDRRVMAAAIRLGAEGLGRTWPNPSVGAILVKDGVVVSRARTADGGRPHAERLALEAAGAEAAGATLFVSLEPCSHHGRTPPCVDAIVAAGVARVVAAMRDPNPQVGGEGFARLRAEEISVDEGLLAADAARAHGGHVSRVARRRPHVTLKLAVSHDNSIGRHGERQAAVTGSLARQHAQALRARFDAILVGRATVETDDPALTVRLPGLEQCSPVRVVLDSAARLRSDCAIFAGDAPTWTFSTTGAPVAEGHHRHFVVPASGEGVDVAAVLAALHADGITRLLVEGGARIARSFLEADLIDAVLLFRSPDALGGEPVPALAGLPLATVEASPRFRRVARRRFGADMLSRYERA